MRKLIIAALLSFLALPAFAQGGGTVVVTPPGYGELDVRYCLTRADGSRFCNAHQNRYTTYSLCEKARQLWSTPVPDPRDPSGATMVPLLKLSVELEGSRQWETLEAKCYGASDTAVWQLQVWGP